MAKWSHRSGLYKVSLVCLYLVFLVFALAFSIPTWYRDVLFRGLWLFCTGDDADFGSCTSIDFENEPDWMIGVRAVWMGGALFYLLAVGFSLVENCCMHADTRDYGITGILGLLAGLCGSAGVIVVAVELKDNVTYLWGFFLACISSGLTLILAFILIICRNLMVDSEAEKGRANRTADYVFAHKPTGPYSADYTNHGFNRDDVPLSNGVTYHHAPHTQPYSMYRGGDTYPSAPYQGNSLPHPRNQHGGMYGQPSPPNPGYNSPFGYDMSRANQRHSVAESADLSNGYTSELIQAEHTLSRNHVGSRGDFGTGGDYIRNDFPPHRNEFYGNGRY